MHTKLKLSAWLFVVVSAITIVGLRCDKKKVNPVEPKELSKLLQPQDLQSSTKTIIGHVADRVTGLGIINANVVVIDTTAGLNVPIGAGITDIAANFVIPGIPVGTFLVSISKIGYIDASVTAFVRENYNSVETQTTFLKPVSKGVVIGAAGGKVTDSDDEGDVITLDVPSGALDSDVSLSVTHLQGLEIPSIPPKGHLSFATAHFGPTGTLFKKPVTISFPLPQQMLPGSELPLYSLEELQRIKWQDKGIKALVNADGLTASAQVDHFSVYSVMPEIQVTETPVDTLWEDYQVLPTLTGYTIAKYKNEYDKLLPEYINFPEGTEGLNRSTLIYMFEQFHGISFRGWNTETIYFASPAGMYARRVTRVLVLEEQMTLVDPTKIVNVKKHVKRPIIEFVSHDQGGGR